MQQEQKLWTFSPGEMKMQLSVSIFLFRLFFRRVIYVILNDKLAPQSMLKVITTTRR